MPPSPQWPLEAPSFGVAVGPRQFIADQLLAKADVIREHVRVSHDRQTEFALRESLGVGGTQRRPVRDRIQESSGTLRVQHTFLGLVAANPRILAMIQDAVTAGLLRKQPLETGLTAIDDTATTTNFGVPPLTKTKLLPSFCSKQSSPGSGRCMATNSLGAQRSYRHEPNSVRKSNTAARPLQTMVKMIWISLRPLGTQCTAVPSAAFTTGLD